MIKITNQRFINYFEKNFRKLDEVYEEISFLENFSQTKTVTKMSNKESHDIGSVVFNVEAGIHEYVDTKVLKFKDLINSIISSINIKSYASAIVLTRALLEHFGMFALKTTELEKHLINKNFLKLSKESAYWGISANESEIAIDHKRTHLMDGIRYLNIYFFEIWKRYPEDSKTYFEELYDEISNLTHPASDSMLMYQNDYEEKWNSSGYKATMFYSNEVNEYFFHDIAYVFNIVNNFLVTDLFPKYKDKVIAKFDNDRDYIVKFFSINPDYAKEILDQTINKKKIDEKRKKLGLDDIDKIRYENFKKINN